jgi:toxin ParE1/3/4
MSDIEAAVEHLRLEGGVAAAEAFIDAIQAALSKIERAPNAGSLRFAFELGIPDVRAWPLRRPPYVIFYLALDDRIDVWRVVHARRDIASTLVDDV